LGADEWIEEEIKKDGLDKKEEEKVEVKE